ncbi:hypothetical protein HanXRQr2_Chr08g0338911 [Helianthus annuus]|uniref:Uncharacterized protein n=1 Tax=Helianthus annuus TaxID=4232 RepID=A0A9K3IEE9_HELAN|nr:hypothetical protein HanXRQr2_Chr08g0338911 [Helianthus annuus]
MNSLNFFLKNSSSITFSLLHIYLTPLYHPPLPSLSPKKHQKPHHCSCTYGLWVIKYVYTRWGISLFTILAAI